MARDAALARAALQDPDVEVRWRATYTLAGLEMSPTHAAEKLTSLLPEGSDVTNSPSAPD